MNRTLGCLLGVAWWLQAAMATAADVPRGDDLFTLAGRQFTNDLSSAERVMFRAAATGGIVYFSYDPYSTNTLIRTSRLQWLCTDPAASRLVNWRGIIIDNGWIGGVLNLNSVKMSFPLAIQNSHFTAPILLKNAELPGLDLSGSQIISLDASGAVFKADVRLANGFQSEEAVNLSGSTIGGNLDCTNGTFGESSAFFADDIRDLPWLASQLKNPTNAVSTFLASHLSPATRAALTNYQGRGSNLYPLQKDLLFDLNSPQVTPSAEEGASFTGVDLRPETRELLAATNRPENAWPRLNRLLLEDAFPTGIQRVSFGSPFAYHNAILAANAEIKGDVHLASGFTANGEVNLWGAAIGGYVDCAGGHFDNPGSDHYSLRSGDAHITGAVYLDSGFEADGEVVLSGSAIGGDLDCTDGHFKNPGANTCALRAANARITGNVYLAISSPAYDMLTNGFLAEGSVVLSGSTIGGDLNCFGGHFLNPGASALELIGANITGNVDLDDTNFLAEGEVSLQNVTIGSNLSCDGGQFINASSTNADNYAIGGDTALVKGNVLLRDGFKAQGMVSFLVATIGGDLDCEGGHFASTNQSALLAASAHINGRALLRHGFEAIGGVSLMAATVGGDVDCEDGHFVNPGANVVALDIERAKIGGCVFLRSSPVTEGAPTNGFRTEGEVDLAGANVGGDLNCFGGRLDNPKATVLDADGATIVGGVYLTSTHFTATGLVSLENTSIGLDLDATGGQFFNPGTNGCALQADSAGIKGNVFLGDGFKASGRVSLLEAGIGGKLYCTGGQFVCPDTNFYALDAEGTKIGGDVFLQKSGATEGAATNGFSAEGEVDFAGATINGNLNCHGGRFGNPGATVLDADGAMIAGYVFFDGPDFTANGMVSLENVNIGLDLNCTGGQFFNPGTNTCALQADSAGVKGNVYMGDGFKATGQVSLQAASIGGKLYCTGGCFENPGNTVEALDAGGTKIGGSVYLQKSSAMAGPATNGFCALGEVNFAEASVTGDLNCFGGHFSNTNATVLDADGASINGYVFLTSSNFAATGCVSLQNASIGLDLDCSGGQFFDQDTNENVIQADSADIKGNVFLRQGFNARGQVSMLVATIGRDLDCSGGHFVNPNTNACALNAERTKIGGDVFFGTNVAAAGVLPDNFTALGTMDLSGATIGGDLECDGGKLAGPATNVPALDASGAKIEGSVYLRRHIEADGKLSFVHATVARDFQWLKVSSPQKSTLDLSFASVGTYCDDEASWPPTNNLWLNGFIYEEIYAMNTNDDSLSTNEDISRLGWLGRQPSNQFFPQPYEHLALVLRKTGHEDEAADVMVAKNATSRPWTKGWSSWLWYHVFGRLIDYGYNPWKPFFYSLGFIVVGTVVFGFASRFNVLLPADEKFYTLEEAVYTLEEAPYPPSRRQPKIKGICPVFNPFIYSLEMFVPLVNMGMKDNWRPNAELGHTLFRRHWLTTDGLVRLYIWIHIIAGWILTTLWVGGLTGLVKT